MDRKPTNAELEILRVLWNRGPSTVREVLRTMQESKDVGYNTVLKLMQIMTDKGLLDCDKSVRPQVYAAAQPKGRTQRQLVNDLVERAFGGSPGNLILQALSSHKASPEERRRIRDFLDQLENTDVEPRDDSDAKDASEDSNAPGGTR